MVEYYFWWEDGGDGSVAWIKCNCGYYQEWEHTRFVVSDGETWTCPKCGKKYKFVWKGIVMEEI